MATDDSHKQRTTIYLSPETAALLKRAAADNDRSFTKQVEHILKDWLARNRYRNNESGG